MRFHRLSGAVRMTAITNLPNGPGLKQRVSQFSKKKKSKEQTRRVQDARRAGIPGSPSQGKREYSRITQVEMKNIMMTAVNRVYTLQEMKESDPDFFKIMMLVWAATTSHWDEPELQGMRNF